MLGTENVSENLGKAIEEMVSKSNLTFPNFPVDDAWYTVKEMKNLLSCPPSLESKRKEQLTCDLTFKDVLDDKNSLDCGDMAQMARVLGYHYFVHDEKVWELIEDGFDSHDSHLEKIRDTNLKRKDINEIL